MYGSSLIIVTLSPRDSRSAAKEAAAMPLPKLETTPPVTNTYLVILFSLARYKNCTHKKRPHARLFVRTVLEKCYWANYIDREVQFQCSFCGCQEESVPATGVVSKFAVLFEPEAVQSSSYADSADEQNGDQTTHDRRHNRTSKICRCQRPLFTGFTEFPAGSPRLEPREDCGLSKFFNLGPNAAKPCT